MAEGGPLINLGEISKPATVLIEKISDAVGGIAKPWQIRRVARAEIQAELMRAKAKVDISAIEQRGLERIIVEEGKRQENIETITFKAISKLNADARPDDMQIDWLAHFFDRSRLTSDEEMQSLWASILAGEANSPGSFSKRTIELVHVLDKKDAELFTTFRTFCWQMDYLVPFIDRAAVDTTDTEPYKSHGIDLEALQHLETAGLASINVEGFVDGSPERSVKLSYFGKQVCLDLPKKTELELGIVVLTKSGKELARICDARPSEVFFDRMVKKWRSKGYLAKINLV